MALSLPTRITLHFCTTFATLLLHFRPGALRMTVRSCRQKKPLVLPHDYPFVPPSFSALRRRVRLRSAGEPDNRVRTFSTRYLTANSHLASTSRPIWPLLATVFPSPLPGSCGTRRSKRLDTGPDGRSSPFRVFDLPVSSRVADK